jgi:hypothetical protein
MTLGATKGVFVKLGVTFGVTDGVILDVTDGVTLGITDGMTPIVNFPFLCSNILLSPTYGVYISKLIRYARALRMRTFQNEANYLEKS